MLLCVLFVGFALAFLFLFELLLVGVNTVLQTAQLLCKRVRQVDLVERIRRRRTDTLTGNLNDARLDADNRGIRRNLLQYDSIRADTAVVTHLERSENLRAGRNEHVVADGRVTLAGVVTGTAELMGAEIYAHCTCDGTSVTVRTPSGEPIHAGDTITAAVDMSRIHLFDKQTERAIAF